MIQKLLIHTQPTSLDLISESVDEFGLPLVEDFKTAKALFTKQAAGQSHEVDGYLADFKALKNRIKDADKRDIDRWKDWSEFKAFIDELKSTKSKTQTKKLAKNEGAELIAENDGWWVYHIKTHEAARLYGSNTKWCITEEDPTNWNNYSTKNNIYFVISKKPRDIPWNKIAVLEGQEPSVWDELDENHDYLSALPKSLKIPSFKTEEPEPAVLVDGKRMTLQQFQASKNLSVGGDLNLEGSKITSLPEGLSVGGYLDLYGTPITSLPEGLSVGGYLDLIGTKITSLPEGLSVGGGLYLNDTPITSLPEGLSVGGDLYLNGTPITSLPEGLSVGGDLNLNGTPITSLPEGLSVGGYLDLYGTPITSLPEGLSVGGYLNLRGTKIKKQGFKKPKGVKGEVFW